MAAASLRVALVDYGAGNLRSVAKALERSGLVALVTSDAAAVARADAVVLPGVGAFAAAVANLRAKGLDQAVRRAIDAGRPYLGLCLGLQLLFEDSDEHGLAAGLGWLAGHVRRFPEQVAGQSLRVPHIGWNEVRWQGGHPMRKALPERDIYYFVHGWRALPASAGDTAGSCDYGGEFAAAVAHENVFAVQFHPEKSQAAGKRVLDAFAAWVRAC
jgi:imidazole glycerol-phosphate synthase subunit HisH